MPTPNKDISLVIAALNEEVLILSTVQEIISNCRDKLTNFELILINDGSTDRTGAIMNEIAQQYPNVQVIHNKIPRNLGCALQSGMQCAKYEYIMLLCGDGGLPGESLPIIFSKIGEADLVIPYMANLKRIKSPARFYLSRCYTNLLNIIFGQKLNYYNGLPVYKTAELRKLKIISKGFAFQAEIITKLLKSGCSYVQVETLGAEKSNRSVAVSFKGFYEIAKILITLIWEVIVFNPSQNKTVPSDRAS
jgi:dolichol-phosphate mannosyltransferase